MKSAVTSSINGQRRRDTDVGNRLAQRLFRNAKSLDPVVDFDRLVDIDIDIDVDVDVRPRLGHGGDEAGVKRFGHAASLLGTPDTFRQAARRYL